MTFIEEVSKFENELNELKVAELYKNECKEALWRLRMKIDEILTLIRHRSNKQAREYYYENKKNL